EEGKDGLKNPVRAFLWYERAGAKGHIEGQGKAAVLRASLSSSKFAAIIKAEEITEAQEACVLSDEATGASDKAADAPGSSRGERKQPTVGESVTGPGASGWAPRSPESSNDPLSGRPRRSSSATERPEGPESAVVKAVQHINRRRWDRLVEMLRVHE